MEDFEAMVCDLVAEALPGTDDYSTLWYSGTLFLGANQEEAIAVFLKLTDYFGIDGVILSKVTQCEYAFDIV